MERIFIDRGRWLVDRVQARCQAYLDRRNRKLRDAPTEGNRCCFVKGLNCVILLLKFTGRIRFNHSDISNWAFHRVLWRWVTDSILRTCSNNFLIGLWWGRIVTGKIEYAWEDKCLVWYTRCCPWRTSIVYVWSSNIQKRVSCPIATDSLAEELPLEYRWMRFHKSTTYTDHLWSAAHSGVEFVIEVTHVVVAGSVYTDAVAAIFQSVPNPGKHLWPFTLVLIDWLCLLSGISKCEVQLPVWITEIMTSPLISDLNVSEWNCFPVLDHLIKLLSVYHQVCRSIVYYVQCKLRNHKQP